MTTQSRVGGTPPGQPSSTSIRPTLLGSEPVAEFVHVTKAFSSTVAADDVSFGLYPGSVLALVGENGAGKSTLVKTLGGVYRADGGHVTVTGAPVTFHSALGAQRAGISVVHQQPGLQAAVRATLHWGAVQSSAHTIATVKRASPQQNSARSPLGASRSATMKEFPW